MPAPPTDDLLRLDVHGLRMARAAAASVRAAAEDLGFAPSDAARAEDVARHLGEAVAARDFDRPADARFTLSIGDRPAALTLRVADHGLPGSLGGEAGAELTRTLVAAGADTVRVASDGDGNTVAAEVARDPAHLAHLVDEETPTEESPDLPAPRFARLARRHLDSLARCTWRVYGHSYVARFLYHPEETWKMVEAGRLHSIVALDADDEVVGHVGIELERAGAAVGDATLALVDPRYRGHHVLRGTQAVRRQVMDDLDLLGTLAEAVTPHTITQRTRVEGGATETGILLGFIPATMTYRGFSADVQGSSRQSAVLSYAPLRPGPARTVHPPAAYRDVVLDCYARMGLVRTEGTPRAGTGTTRLDVVADGPRSLATIEVAAVGADAAHVVDLRRRELCAAGTEVVHAELPLDDPGTPAAVEVLRDRGFRYAGFVPDLRDADVLRLQYLDVDVDTEIIQLYTDEARDLLALTLADEA
ncbi:hypothetical protein PO878_03255 [Iamia majanohamensis]|uniref:N-acetyltransferase domain-containing protein n=1 Tax=Iamia majanohamensis TaxID=467976 RepID=A0AAE9Y8L1_9ACTN|nr:hypothetical protein [Iamia majanohamensis]WCO67741.1 hypothetical protein PO878_03255 [Iamia majanohamensis]